MTGRTNAGDGDLSITIAVCTHNRAHLLATTLREVSRQQSAGGHSSELVVVDSASSDGTSELLERLSREMPLRVITLAVSGLARARNAAIDCARGRYIVFLDDDAVPAEGWLSAYGSATRGSDAVMIAGKVRLRFESAPASWLRRCGRAAALLSALDLGPDTRALSTHEYPVGANMAVSAELARAVGGFNVQLGRVGKQLLSMEEVDFADRIRANSGHLGVWEPKPAVDHHVPSARTTRLFLIRRAYWQGRSVVRLARLRADLSRRRPGTATLRVASAIRHIGLLVRPSVNATAMDRLLDAAYELGRAAEWIESVPLTATRASTSR